MYLILFHPFVVVMALVALTFIYGIYITFFNKED